MNLSINARVEQLSHSGEPNVDIASAKVMRDRSISHLERTLKDLEARIKDTDNISDAKHIAKLIEKRDCVAQTLARAKEY